MVQAPYTLLLSDFDSPKLLIKVFIQSIKSECVPDLVAISVGTECTKCVQ